MKKEIKIKQLTINNNIIFWAPTKKYKTFTIGCTFFDQLKTTGNAEKTILSALMGKKNNKYPDNQLFSNYLKDLYNMSYSSYVNRIGLTSMTNYFLGSVNGKYLGTDMNLFQSAVNVVKDCLLEPCFDQQSLDIEKQLLISDIENIYNNKAQYANHQFLKNMFSDELIYTSRINNVEMIKDISINDIKKMYNHLLSLPRIFFVIGDISEDEINNEFADFTLPKAEEVELDFIDLQDKEFDEPTIVIEEMPINQSILNIGYRTDIRLDNKEYDATFTFNAMLGQYFHSSLFQIIREEHGLAYYIGSDYNSRKGNIAISCAIDAKNYDKTVNLIKNIIEDYQTGQIDDENLTLTKKAIINQVLKSEDSQGTIYTNVIQKYSGMNSSTIDEKIKRINAITIDDIKLVSQHLKLDTIYFLKGQKNNEKNTQ